MSKLSDTIKRMIAEGEIPLGQQMPSRHKLASPLSVSPDEVGEAYRQLVDEDVVSVLGKGTLYFAGSWSVLSRPDFKRPHRLAQALGEFFSIRESATGDFFPLKMVTLDKATRKGVLHSHDYYELVYLRSGSGVHLRGGEQYPVYAGDCYLVLPYQKHQQDLRDGVVTNVMFYPELLSSVQSELYSLEGFAELFPKMTAGVSGVPKKVHLSITAQREFDGILHNLETELSGRILGNTLMAKSLLVSALIFLCRTYQEASAQESEQSLDTREQLVARAISYLEQNLADDIRIPALAKSMFVSSSTLQHAFKASTGMSIMDYLIKIRIEQACEELTSTTFPISHVASVCGFRNQAYFGRVFKAHTGQTPSNYRKNA